MAIIFTDLAGVLVAATIQLGIAFACFALFTFYLSPKWSKVFEPKVLKTAKKLLKRPPPIFSQLESDIGNERGSTAISTLSKKSSWLATCNAMKREDLIAFAGLDAYFLISFTSMSKQIFFYLSFLAVPLAALNYLAPLIDQSSVTANERNETLSLTTLTMANVSSKSNLFYVHTTFAFIFTFLVCRLLDQFYKEYLEMRQEYVASEAYQKAFFNSILLITDNIKTRQDSERFQAYLGSCNLQTVPISVKIGRNLKNLPELLKKHFEMTVKLEKCLASYLKDAPKSLPEERPTHHEGGYLFGLIGGNKVDSIKFYKAELDKLEVEIYRLQSNPENEFDTDASVFLSFGSVREKQTAALEMKKKKIPCKDSPSFSDIIWDNIGVEPVLKKSRQSTAILITAGLIIGWVFMQSAIAALSGSLITNSGLPPSVIVFLQSIVTPLINVILNILLPLFLREIAKLQCVLSHSGVERSATYKFFTFQVYQYITQLAAQVIFSFAANIISGKGVGDVNAVINQLAIAFVSQSTYFITFVVTGYSGFGIELLQIGPLVVNPLMKKFLAATPREKEAFNEIQEFDYLAAYGALLMTLLLGLSYSVVAPLICFFVAGVFMIANATLKYTLVYIYKSKTETGGRWVNKVFHMVISCLVIFQLSTCGAVLVLSRGSSSTGVVCSILLLCLPGLTLIYWGYIWFYLRPLADEALLAIESGRLASTPSSRVLRSASNPLLCRKVPKVWVDTAVQETAQELYQPAFKDMVEYVKSSTMDPKRWEEAEVLEDERRRQRELMEAEGGADDGESSTSHTRVNSPVPPATLHATEHASPDPSIHVIS